MFESLLIRIPLLCIAILFASIAYASNIFPIAPARDQVLSHFVQDALSIHPLIKAEKATLAARNAEQRAASKAIYNPELELDAESATDDTFSIGLNQTIDLGNKRSAREKVAAAKYTLSQARLVTVKNTVSVQLLKSLAAFHSASHQVELATNRLKIVEEFANLADRKFLAGDISKTESSLAALSLTQAQIDIATQQSLLAEAEQSLHLQVQNTSDENWPQLPTDFPEFSLGKSDVNLLVKSLPEVQLAQKEVAVLSNQIDLRKRERKPDPTIGIRGGEEGSDTLVGVNISFPLFIRNSFDAEVVVAQSEMLEAEYRYQNSFNKATTRLTAATTRFQKTQIAWKNWRNSNNASFEKQTGLLKRLWEAGELSTTDYLVQLNQLLDMQVSATELRHQLWRAWFDWLEMSGTVSHWLDLEENF